MVVWRAGGGRDTGKGKAWGGGKGRKKGGGTEAETGLQPKNDFEIYLLVIYRSMKDFLRAIKARQMISDIDVLKRTDDGHSLLYIYRC